MTGNTGLDRRQRRGSTGGEVSQPDNVAAVLLRRMEGWDLTGPVLERALR